MSTTDTDTQPVEQTADAPPNCGVIEFDQVPLDEGTTPCGKPAVAICHYSDGCSEYLCAEHGNVAAWLVSSGRAEEFKNFCDTHLAWSHVTAVHPL